MIHSGLLSVTFRQLSPQDIIKQVSKAGLHAIEWGGDIHVPHGDVGRAKQVRQWTVDEGITISSYGSYYRVGCPPEDLTFESVLHTAAALEAPSIRVWAGDRGSQEADAAWFDQVVWDARRICSLAQDAGMTIDFEYHGGTLTDTREMTIRLLKEINHPNVRCNWQPVTAMTIEERKQDLLAVLPWIANVHVFQWEPGIRHPLQHGEVEWQCYLEMVKEGTKEDAVHYAMLEFVKEDTSRQFEQDATVLRRIITNG